MAYDVLEGSDPFSGPSFSKKNRLKRAVWGLVSTLLFRPSPKMAVRWRCTLLRAFGAKLGNACNVHQSVRIWAPWNLVMEDASTLAERVTCYSMATITLGRRAVVSQGSHLCAGTHDYQDVRFPLQAYPISIGAEAWICADAFVGPGVSVGEGAVLGARGVATRNIGAWEVHAGNPAKFIKKRVFRER